MIKTDYQRELQTPSTYKKIGSEGKAVRRIQEWINLWHFYEPNWQHEIVVDGDFGRATAQAVRKFQRFRNIFVDGMVGPQTWRHLTLPMRQAFYRTPFMDDTSINQRVVEFAKQHLGASPYELSQNEGPWVRAYMKGQDGAAMFWCAGFVCTILDQAYDSMDVEFTDHYDDTWRCDDILNRAEREGILFRHDDLVNKNYEPVVGDIFLLVDRTNPSDATHVGFIVANEGDGIVTTIEGNTNSSGSRNGTQVAQRGRNIFYKDRYHTAVVQLKTPILRN